MGNGAFFQTFSFQRYQKIPEKWSGKLMKEIFTNVFSSQKFTEGGKSAPIGDNGVFREVLFPLDMLNETVFLCFKILHNPTKLSQRKEQLFSATYPLNLLTV